MRTLGANTSAACTLADIRIAVARGKADVEAGRMVDAAEAFAELEAYFRALARGEGRGYPGQLLIPKSRRRAQSAI